MTKQRWAVRIIVSLPEELKNNDRWEERTNRDDLWLGEILRYAGLSRDISGLRHDGVRVYDLYAPPGITDTAAWAHRNAQRISSFGISAAAAPEWPR